MEGMRLIELVGKGQRCGCCDLPVFDGTPEMAKTATIDSVCAGSLLDYMLQFYAVDDLPSLMNHVALAIEIATSP